MLKIEIKNAVVEDRGYGPDVNGEGLCDIISTALGTKVGKTRAGYGKLCDVLKPFRSNCCDVTVLIDPKPASTLIEDGESIWNSVESMEEAKREQFEQKNQAHSAEE